jgi:hypothetical protein
MQLTSTGSIRLAKFALMVIFAWSVYRAATESVTPGEALNYDRFIGPHWNESLAQFDSNNHILNTILIRISTARIHLTEFSLRMPSLLFGALYLWAAYRISRRWFGDGRMFLAVLGILVLNPLTLDAISEARGYGMALACWMWALELVAGGGSMAMVGVLLGLSVSGSLAFLAPAAALMLVARGRRKWGYMPQLAFLTAFMLLILPLNHAEKDMLLQGATSLRQTLNELTASLGFENGVVQAAVRIGIGLLTAVGVIGLLRRKTATLTFLVGGSLAVSLGLVWMAHWKIGSVFPQSGAIYLVPMVTLFVASLVQERRQESVEIAFVAVAVLLVVNWVEHTQLPYRGEGELAGGRNVAKALRSDAMQRGVRVAVSPEAEPIMRYYRWRYRQANWGEILPVDDSGFHYYVLTARDAGLVERRGLHVLYRDRGLVLAK